MVETCQRLDEHICTLISVFVTTGSEEVQGVVGIEVVVSIEMPTHEIMDLLLGLLVQILELVHGREFGDVEAVGQHAIRLAGEQMLTLVGRDVGDGGEDIAGVGGSSFDAVTVVDTTLAGFRVYIEVLQVIVEIDGASAEVASQERGMGCEDGSHINLTLPAEGQSYTSQPFVEVRNDGFGRFMSDVLHLVSIEITSTAIPESSALTSPKNQATR